MMGKRGLRVQRWLVLRALGAALLTGLALASTPRALADEVVAALHLGSSAVMGTGRDPLEFASDLTPVMPRPVVVLNLSDAVARELVQSTRTMTQADALRTAQALIDEGRSLHWDPLLFVAVIHVESDYDHLAISPRGAEGLMQLMPETAEWMAARLDLLWPAQSFDPVLNVRLGTHYLAHLSHQFRKLDQVLTAYNRGPQATHYILREHGRLPTMVRDSYATKVLRRYQQLRAAYGHLQLG